MAPMEESTSDPVDTCDKQLDGADIFKDFFLCSQISVVPYRAVIFDGCGCGLLLIITRTLPAN